MIVRSQMSQQPFSKSRQEQGSTFLLVLGLGLIMTLMGLGLMIQALKGSAIASGRKDSGKATAITEAGIARTLTLLKQPFNTALLTRNYDPINPKTGKTYLGADGALNTGDEEAIAVNEWTGYAPATFPCYQQAGVGSPTMPTTGTIGTNGSYTLRAYRYDSTRQLGVMLMEGTLGGGSSAISVTFSLNPLLDNFPGISIFNGDPLAAIGSIGLRGRQVLGTNGNIYYNPVASADPMLSNYAAPGDPARPSYLNAIWSSNIQDGAGGDTVAGKIFACQAYSYIPNGNGGTNLGIINTSQTLIGTGGTVPTYYQAQQITLNNSNILTVDTTNGPVYIEMLDTGNTSIILRNTAKILNVRTDGKSPRVGDLRILTYGDKSRVQIYDQTCIQNAFLWILLDELSFLTSGAGCPSGRNTNFEGVIWAEAVLSSKNAVSNRNINYLNYWQDSGRDADTTVTIGATSGIYVPDDLSSLIDLLPYIKWPVRYQINKVQSWQRQRL